MYIKGKRILALAATAAIVLTLLLVIALALPYGDGHGLALAADGDQVINIADSANLHWVVSGVNSDLRDGKIYEYSYRKSGKIYEYFSVVKMSEAPYATWENWDLVNTYDVKISIMRYRGEDSTFNHQVGVRGPLLDTGFTVEFSTEAGYQISATAPGRYLAKAVFTAKDGYVFSNNDSERATLSERGIDLEIDPDGKHATMTKRWYLANYDNALLNGNESITARSEVEFDIPSWKFGEYTQIDYPWLYHGDGALNADMDLNGDYQVKVKSGDEYVDIIESITTPGRTRTVDLVPEWDPRAGVGTQHNDIVTFNLTRIVNGARVSVTTNTLRSSWSYYINQFMPAGDYELVIDVKDIILYTHKHWWDGSEHTVANSILNPDQVESEYKGFSRTFNFSVLPGDLTITNDDVLNQNNRPDMQRKRLDIDTIDINHFETVFSQSESQVKFEFAMKYSEIVASNENRTSYWTDGTNLELYFDQKPHLEYNLYRMKNDSYYAADDAIWAQYFTTPSTYTVYYMAKMKNHASDPDMLNRYDKYYEIILYKHILVPTLNRNELYYTGGELSVQPKEEHFDRDMSLYTWSGNTAVEVGDYKAVFELTDGDHYKWMGNREYDFNENFELSWSIKPATIIVPTIADRVYRGGSAIRPAITVPVNQVLNKEIFTVSYPENHTDGTFTDAGTYDITLTLSDKNYVWATGDEDKDGIITVKFTIIPENNVWVVTPRVTQWQWNGYNKAVNIIEGAPMRGVSHFCISYDADGRSPLNGLEDFTVINGEIDDITAQRLYELNSGVYYLNAAVEAGKNWTELKSEPIRFEVAVARNYWESSPNIIRWKYDGFDPSINLITAVPHFGDTVTFSIVSKLGSTPADDVVIIHRLIVNEKGEAQGLTATELAKLEAGGTYYLKAVVDRKSAGFVNNDPSMPIYNYTEMLQYVEFHIQQANNYWTQTPNIERWIAGEVPSEPTGISNWGTAVFVIYDEKNNDAIVYDSTQSINNLADVQPGWYRIEAMVAGNANYTSLTSVTRFKVFSAELNFWNIVPNIQGWTEGSAHNVPVGKSAFGEITYSYYTKADYDNNGLNAKKLDGVPTVAGDYVMVAIAESSQHDDLVAAVKFTIYKNVSVNAKTYIGIIGGFSAIIGVGIIISALLIVKEKRKFKKLAMANGGETATASDAEDSGEVNRGDDYESQSYDNSPYDDVDSFDNIVVDVTEEDDTPALDPTSID